MINSAQRVAIYTMSFCAIFLGSRPSNAQGLEQTRQALDLIDDTADHICRTVASQGSATTNSVKGQISAQANGLVKRLTSMGAYAGGEHTSNTWSGILAGDLPTALHDNMQCRLQVFNSLKGSLLRDTSLVQAQRTVAKNQEAKVAKRSDRVIVQKVDVSNIHISQSYLVVDQTLAPDQCAFQLFRAGQTNDLNIKKVMGDNPGLAYVRSDTKVLITCLQGGWIIIGVAGYDLENVSAENGWAQKLVRTVMAEPK